MADFLEERIHDLIEYGSAWQDSFSVNVVQTAGGQEYRSLLHPMPVRRFDISYLLDIPQMWTKAVNLYYRAHGRYAGFRARCFDEYSSNGAIGTPTGIDQPMLWLSGATYQMRKFYGKEAPAGATGYAYRTIYKPVVGTVKVGAGSTELPSWAWTCDHTKGQVTMTANKAVTITGISNDASAVITTSNTQGLQSGDSVHVSGVLGMTQINNLRAPILSVVSNVSLTVSINSSAFGTYTSGGVGNTAPQAGETVSAGFEFDFPVRFDTELSVTQNIPTARDIDSLALIELLNP